MSQVVNFGRGISRPIERIRRGPRSLFLHFPLTDSDLTMKKVSVKQFSQFSWTFLFPTPRALILIRLDMLRDPKNNWLKKLDLSGWGSFSGNKTIFCTFGLFFLNWVLITRLPHTHTLGLFKRYDHGKSILEVCCTWRFRRTLKMSTAVWLSFLVYFGHCWHTCLTVFCIAFPFFLFPDQKVYVSVLVILLWWKYIAINVTISDIVEKGSFG